MKTFKSFLILPIVFGFLSLMLSCSGHSGKDTAGTASEVVTNASISGTLVSAGELQTQSMQVALYLVSADTTVALMKTTATDSLIGTVTVTSGKFQFSDLSAGLYRIAVLQDSVNVGGVDSINLGSGQNLQVTIEINILIQQTITITTNNISVQNINVTNGVVVNNDNGTYTFKFTEGSSSLSVSIQTKDGDSTKTISALLVKQGDGSYKLVIPEGEGVSVIQSSSSSNSSSSSILEFPLLSSEQPSSSSSSTPSIFPLSSSSISSSTITIVSSSSSIANSSSSSVVAILSSSSVVTSSSIQLSSSLEMYSSSMIVSSSSIALPSSSSACINTYTATTVTDCRDGQTYNTTLIGSQTWMAQNLNYDTANGTGSWCYSNTSSYCATYGHLYDRTTAMAGAASSTATPSGVQGVCMSGWHLPSDAEWIILEGAAGGSGNAGYRLKAISGWYNNGNGSDLYGFNALPSGYYNSTLGYKSVTTNAYWWSATNGDYWLVSYNGTSTATGYNNTGRMSVRCLKD